MNSLKNILSGIRVKFFLWLMGKDNNEMWHELTKHYITDMRHNNYGRIEKHSDLGYELNMVPALTYLDDYTRIQNHFNFISARGKLVVKKYAAIGAGCIVIPGNHVPTVGVPQYLAGRLHINDVDNDIVVCEDAWVGAGTILLSHCKIGRGAVVAAGAVVSKPVPPYAVVAGVPAKIIATRFTIDQILQHESELYPPEERMSREDLEDVFNEYFPGKKSIGKSEMSKEDRVRLEKEKCELGILTY